MPTHEVEILAEGRDGIRSLVLSGAIVTRTGGSTASRPWTPSGKVFSAGSIIVAATVCKLVST